MKLVFVTKKLSRLWLLLEALFGFQEKKLASYHDFGSLPGVFENQFQMTFQIDNFFFQFQSSQNYANIEKSTKRPTCVA